MDRQRRRWHQPPTPARWRDDALPAQERCCGRRGGRTVRPCGHPWPFVVDAITRAVCASPTAPVWRGTHDAIPRGQ
ncbi:hypothetical protein LI99_05070 [Mycolicibacterium smegmatis]|uniref:Uncharacterized protein n=1 Tax=Mycolicibacterium smegmatis (strain ATCC 700084 / mc(2)155) TaxID=246196 RepID=A0QR83_MYCS2|nr:conserved hypothetical protein [Mycolicibacterium smegmatis MC2 155]ABK75154.1 conserved hypothetical protein [Mycolicibacterium smegmatis MC2 155]AIU11899.1 hypothetical protein LJ00_05070 [Mycolicibacterium smegmatis MC2 155]AIU18524.1 hypothetical protein LI99_05070 [Mycolicibacterium smegmatis]AIU25146.1 hypothetical protein LI98_05070 [Mycolicibacterium smegmatis]